MREARRPTTCSLASTSLSCRPAVSIPCRSADSCCRSHGLKYREAISLLTLSNFLDIPLHYHIGKLLCARGFGQSLRRSTLCHRTAAL